MIGTLEDFTKLPDHEQWSFLNKHSKKERDILMLNGFVPTKLKKVLNGIASAKIHKARKD